MNWYLSVLKNYAAFGGRARRKEYWMFVLFNIIITIALIAVEAVIGSRGILEGLYMLGIIVPSIAVLVRRLHDTGRSGFWFFIALVPLIGGLVLLYFLVQDGQPGENNYGSNPKSAGA